MPESKLSTLEAVVARFISDGSEIVMGTCLESMIPFAVGHEIIRQQKRELTLVGPISDILFDQLIGAGCVRRLRCAWTGNVITGSGYNFRRAAEAGRIAVEDHSNMTLAMALKAGAMGIPFLPTYTALGSDLPATNPSLGTVVCPFSGKRLTAVAAITPDLAIIHVQRADEFGNTHLWGNLGVTRDACLASRNVVVTAEEIVPSRVITADPNRVVTPGFRVKAVAAVPWGAHPSPVPGCYNRDHQAFLEYRQQSRSPEAFETWRRQWILAATDRAAYTRLVGESRLASLRLHHSALSETVDYGY